jgi:hypothetical protein
MHIKIHFYVCVKRIVCMFCGWSTCAVLLLLITTYTQDPAARHSPNLNHPPTPTNPNPTPKPNQDMGQSLTRKLAHLYHYYACPESCPVFNLQQALTQGAIGALGVVCFFGALCVCVSVCVCMYAYAWVNGTSDRASLPNSKQPHHHHHTHTPNKHPTTSPNNNTQASAHRAAPPPPPR